MAELFKNREQFIIQIAEELKVLGAGQVLSIEDHDKIDDMIDPVLQMLARRDLIGGIYTDQIPLEFFVPLSQILARHCGVPFGVTKEELEILLLSAAQAEKDILAMTLARGTGQRAQPEYM